MHLNSQQYPTFKLLHPSFITSKLKITHYDIFSYIMAFASVCLLSQYSHLFRSKIH